MAWKALNSFIGVGGLASALAIGIPALVKANRAEDNNDGSKDIENNVVYLRSKIYSDDKYSALDKQVALLQQAQSYQQQINDMQIKNTREWVQSNFMRGALFLPAGAVNPLPMQRFNSWEAPIDAASVQGKTAGE